MLKDYTFYMPCKLSPEKSLNLVEGLLSRFQLYIPNDKYVFFENSTQSVHYRCNSSVSGRITDYLSGFAAALQ